MEIYTIGHSTHTKATFLKMLQQESIKNLTDVRAFPGSRKFPEYSQDSMPNWLNKAGIEYDHIPKLGGRRSKSENIGGKLNDGWNNPSFHNYADYTLSDQFQEGIKTLSQIAYEARTAYFCAERHPARCHRLIISNWLTANGCSVKHIIDQNNDQIEVVEHKLGKWGAMPIIETDGTVVYPKL